MQAIVYHNYGSPDVLKLEEVQKPVLQDNEVLVKVVAASTAAGDWHLLRADPFLIRFMFGLLRPKYKILGSDVAGRVEAVGRNVTEFRPGDEVFGDLSMSGFGAFAEYVAAPENAFALKPTNLTFEQAASVPVSAVTALQGLREGHIQPGQKVLINGASGGVGTFAVQIAKAFGAEVTAVCSTSKVEMARSIGADHVIDYTQEDFTQNGEHYDLILAVNGYHPLSAYQRALSPKGAYVITGGSTAQMFEAMLLAPWRSRKDGQKMSNILAKPNQKDLVFMKELIEAGKVTPVIDRCFPLRYVADAIRYLEAGHAKGKVVIAVEHNGKP
ncbi:MAG: NAD(P)-dependent alcohol dehydrogenase [Caldilineaceae bacterium]|nr:NAD(P)-dependent alcohol dehydrogenase [Caldilineaceae bacterium]